MLVPTYVPMNVAIQVRKIHFLVPSSVESEDARLPTRHFTRGER